MIKKISFVLCLLISFTSFKVNAMPAFNLEAKSSVLMEASTGKILYEKNPHDKLPPASVTKVMTILLIYDAIAAGKIKLTDMVTISEHAANMGGSQIFLEPFEQQNVADLLKSIVVASANDAAVGMAEYLGGSEENFVQMMNAKAKALGMNDTTFRNACGLDTDGHVTSAHDIALMSRELITKYPQVFELTKIWMDNIVHKTRRGETQFGLSNTNKLIRSYNGATGLKTGSTSQALFCISATAKRDNMNLISVIMGAPNPATRFNEATKLLDYGFANYGIMQGEAAGVVKGQIKIYKGEKDNANVAIKDRVSILIAKGSGKELTSRTEISDALNAPVPAGMKAGEIIYTMSGEEVGRSDLIITNEIPKASLSQMIGKLLKKWFE